MTDVIGEIRELYRRWLGGDLSQEDALFAIGDLLDEEAGEISADLDPQEGQGPSAGA